MGWAWLAALPVGLWGVVIVDAAQQVLRGRPTFLPFERLLFKRLPASAPDCVLQGAGRLVLAAGVVIVVAPWSLAGFMGNLQSGSLQAEHALGVSGMVCAAIGLVYVACASFIESRVHFTRLAKTARPDAPG